MPCVPEFTALINKKSAETDATIGRWLYVLVLTVVLIWLLIKFTSKIYWLGLL